MDRQVRQAVYETLADIFETVFLIPLEHLADGENSRGIPGLRQEYLEVRIDLLKERNCPAFFFFPADLLQEIAGNFLGLGGEAMDQEKLAQVARMAAGVTIGGLLARVDPQALIKAGEPQSRNIHHFVPGRLVGTSRVGVYKTGQGYLWVDVGRLDEVAHC